MWRKSSYSNPSGNCVEVDDGGDPVVVRDSKSPWPVLMFSRAAWAAFVAETRRGEQAG